MEVSDPRAYLQTEARIIAKNDTYTVFAVRVANASIERNMPLLAALADLMMWDPATISTLPD